MNGGLLKMWSTLTLPSSQKIAGFVLELSMLFQAPERITFLNRIHLFYGLDENQMQLVAEAVEEATFPADHEIIKQGELGDRLYLIWQGKVSVTASNQERPLATFVAGDYFGEESVIVKHHLRTATVTTLEETTVLELTRDQFNILLQQAPGLRKNFTVTVISHHLERRVHFKWLQPGEVIYFLARKHPILFVKALIWPVLLAVAAIIGMLVAWYYSLWIPGIQVLWYFCLFISLGAAGWGAWNGIDWGNDYYIVTDRRVVWLEKVIGIYDSRQESPLQKIQRVAVNTDLLGRQFDYGDLVVRTIVGTTLLLRNVNHPYQAAALIEEHWRRSQEISHTLEKEEMHQALRSRLIPGQSQNAPLPGIVAKPEPKKKDVFRGQRSLANLFRLRFEEKTIVTYRKHIFVMFQQTLIPGLIMIVLIGLLLFDLLHPAFSFSSITAAGAGALFFIWFLLFLGSFLWWLYQYIDWSNDIFQVTPDQIMDIDKTPLGEVQSDVASLDNILSIEYERKGILELAFNYGYVMITVGGGKQMVFENVYNPSAVQEDIERRRLEKISQKEQEHAKADREHLADWFAAYHDNQEEFDQTEPREENPTGDDEVDEHYDWLDNE
jgi:CRP-like cAMP-binding protein